MTTSPSLDPVTLAFGAVLTPDHRWLRALSTVRGYLPRSTHRQPGMPEAIALARWSLGKKSAEEPAEAAQAAHQISQGDTRVRTHLECLVLADVPVEQIAERLEIDPATVATYESAFFDVRVRRSAVDWVRSHAVQNLQRCQGSIDNLILRHLAYTHGAAIFDIACAVMSGQPLTDVNEEVLDGVRLQIESFRLSDNDRVRMEQLRARTVATHEAVDGVHPKEYHQPRRPRKAAPRRRKTDPPSHNDSPESGAPGRRNDM